jgi:hypothetical protein
MHENSMIFVEFVHVPSPLPGRGPRMGMPLNEPLSKIFVDAGA